MNSINRSQGGGSITDGSIEIMVHRRLLYDDARGVKEPLNETAFGQGLVVRGRHILLVETPSTSAFYHRIASQRLYMHPLATFALPQSSYMNYSTTYRQTWSALNDILPLNIHLLTFDQISIKSYIVRVEHFFELNEDQIYSHPVNINLQSIFQSIGIINNTVELTLSANLPLADMKRLNWITNDHQSSHIDVPQEKTLKDTIITLNPMQIRTFQVTII